MNELLTIINLASALSKSFNADIERLDIRYNYEKEITEAYLYLEGAVDIAKITGYVTVSPKKELREQKPETAAEAMEEMKVAVDSLEIPKKTKTESETKKRPKDRQELILKMYNEGCTKVKMAEKLGIGLSTVNYHIQALRDKGKI